MDTNSESSLSASFGSKKLHDGKNRQDSRHSRGTQRMVTRPKPGIPANGVKPITIRSWDRARLSRGRRSPVLEWVDRDRDLGPGVDDPQAPPAGEDLEQG